MESTQEERNVELVKESGSALVDLVRTELELARRELRANAFDAQRAGTLVMIAAGSALIGSELVVGGIVAAGRRHPAALVGVGCLLLGASVGLALEARA